MSAQRIARTHLGHYEVFWYRRTPSPYAYGRSAWFARVFSALGEWVVDVELVAPDIAPVLGLSNLYREELIEAIRQHHGPFFDPEGIHGEEVEALEALIRKVLTEFLTPEQIQQLEADPMLGPVARRMAQAAQPPKR